MSFLVGFLVLVVLQKGWFQPVDSQQGGGFPSLDEVRGNGSMLVKTSTLAEAGTRTLLFPSMNFTCNGIITKLTFLAVPRARDSRLVIRSFFQIGRMYSEVDNTTYVGYPSNQGLNIDKAVHINGSVTGYELNYENGGISFQAGEVFGLHQSTNSLYYLLHQIGERIETCSRNWKGNNFICTVGGDIDRPLVAVETDPPDCARGFIDIAALRLIMAATELTSHPYTLDFNRSIYFGCRGSTVRKWTVGARITGHSREKAPHILINDLSSHTTIHTSELCSLNATSYLNVYEYELSPPVQVNQAQYIAVDSTQIYYQRCGIVRWSGQCIGLPLVAVDADCSSTCSNLKCTPGFIGLDKLRETARYIPNFAEVENDTILFPYLRIVQDGNIVKWTFTAEDLGEGEGRTNYPDLLILDPDNGGLHYDGMDSANGVVHHLSGGQAVYTKYSNVYEYAVDPPAPVKAGYFIAIHQPPKGTARMLLSFVKLAGLGTIDLEMNHHTADYQLQPLVNLEIFSSAAIQPSSSPILSPTLTPTPTPTLTPAIAPTLTPTPTPTLTPTPTPTLTPAIAPTLTPTPTPTLTPATTPTNNEDEGQDGSEDGSEGGSKGSSDGAIVGGIFAVLIVAVAAAATVVIVILLVRRRRGKVSEEGKTNPIHMQWIAAECAYSERVSEPRYVGHTELPESQVYAEPSTTGGYNGHTATGSTQPPTSPPPPIDSQYSVVAASEEYTQPHVTHARNLNAVSNPDYFYTQPHVNTTKNPSECAVYVPTKEQREQLSDDYVYSTLAETQIGAKGGKKTFFEECDIYWNPASSQEGLYAQLSHRKYREIPPHQIRVTEQLGSGQFGTVNRGVWQDGKACVEVAVKVLQEGTSEKDTVRFLQEAAINGQFKHPNIVQLLGVVTVGKPVMIVTELVHNGDLRTYLLSTFSQPEELPPSDTAGVLSQFCVQVAMGMDYLSSKAYVHRDLAARNILVTENKTCKISDFGMSRDLVENSYYVSHGGQIPVKWTAPEALHMKKYSTASDVWSFGCLMYEIWSLGHKPFEGYTNPETIRLIDAGRRLAPPPGCPQEMYHIMITCWNPDKSARPQFRQIVQSLSRSQHELLYIPEEVSRGHHPQACLLGAPLEAGRNLYTELQNTYIQS